jgi:hypothetical protein
MDTKDLKPKGLKTDDAIVELYWQRDENAIKETDRKYGEYLLVIADNIVHNRLDSEECLNDTYLGTWNRIPPTRPVSLQAFLTRIMRNVSVGKFRQNTADKRIPSELITSLDELEDCIAGESSVDSERAARELAVAVADTNVKIFAGEDCMCEMIEHLKCDSVLNSVVGNAGLIPTLRAIENGRYVARAANTGISTIITDKGEVIERLDPLVEGIVVADVEVNAYKTLYSIIGNVFVYAWMAVVAVILIHSAVCRLFKKKQK